MSGVETQEEAAAIPRYVEIRGDDLEPAADDELQVVKLSAAPERPVVLLSIRGLSKSDKAKILERALQFTREGRTAVHALALAHVEHLGTA